MLMREERINGTRIVGTRWIRKLIISHLGKNPKSGGRPPSERILTNGSRGRGLERSSWIETRFACQK